MGMWLILTYLNETIEIHIKSFGAACDCAVCVITGIVHG